ncbi:hypothetical protein [Streptomyces sp. enrichment culture]|uniref:hypothetical protein n=1 Tax=Streptomyces sp. enrichment culture TaxID=1795815 RepID=UPI003F567935
MVLAASGGGKKDDDEYMKALEQFANSGAGDKDPGKVYMGKGYASPYGPHGGSGGVAPDKGHDLWVSTKQAEQEFYTWGDKKQKDFTAQGILSGLLKVGDGPMEAGALWKKLVKEASAYGAAGQKVSPIDLMASYVKASGGANAWVQRGVFEFNTQTGESRYVGPGTYLGNGRAQQTDTRVDLTDPDTARAVATKLFQDMMGRDPGQGELGSFASALHSAEEASPVVSTTTTEYNMETGQPIGSDTTQSGGLTSEARSYIAEQQIKSKKEYGAYQAATTYQNAFDALIFGSPE